MGYYKNKYLETNLKLFKLKRFMNLNSLLETYQYQFNDDSLIRFSQGIQTVNNDELKSLITTLIEMDGFWINLKNYARYFISVMLGTTYIMIKPITKMFRNTKTATLTLLLILCAVYALFTTLNAM